MDPYEANQNNYNQQSNSNVENRNNLGYRNNYNENGNNHANNHHANNHHANNDNYSYNADEDTDEEDYQNYEDYQDYIEELTEGWGDGCSTTTLDEKLAAVDTEITRVAESYETLVKGIADQTLENFLETESLEASYSAELSEWHQNAVGRASQFQRISVEDLNRAFLYLLPSFDVENKYMILNENDEDSPMHDMIKQYAYKMITALFTRSNITYAVIQYDTTPSTHQFMENLLGVMRSASRITNQFLREDWDSFVTTPMDRTMYVHSGGNMTVMIAGVLCYLYDVWNSGYYQYNTYGVTLLEAIRQEFENELMLTYENVDGFYQALSGQMQNENFRNSIRTNTEKISDLDLIFMAPDYFVDTIENPYLSQVNELTAYILRRIMVTAHREEGYEAEMAYHLLPFAGSYDDHWSRFKFSNMSGITPRTVAQMRALHEDYYWGYRQTSNLVEDVPMYLNRIKQGYRPFFDLDLSEIPENLQYEYASKYGECLDCSIGVNTNPLYSHKQYNYINGYYYTLDTVLYEFNYILDGPRDDKYQKRLERRDFLNTIHNDPVNALFQIIGRHIS